MKTTDSPRKIKDTVVAVTADTSKGTIDVIDILNISISNVNRIPASGALNIPATAPAAPQPSRMVMFLYERPSF